MVHSPEGLEILGGGGRWASLLRYATATFSDQAGSDRLSYADMDRLTSSRTENAIHTDSSLLDMDLVRGSSLRKRWQPDRRVNSAAASRVCLMPLHARYWSGELGWMATASLATLWLLYFTLLWQRFVQASLRLPWCAEPLQLWSLGESTDMELLSPALLLLVLGLAYGGYAVETVSVLPPVIAKAANVRGKPASSTEPLGGTKASLTSTAINETDTDSSEDSESEDSESDDDFGDATDGTAGTSGKKAAGRGRETTARDTRAAADAAAVDAAANVAKAAKDARSRSPLGRASISSRGAIRATIWETVTEEERNMPFVVGATLATKRYVDLQDIGRIIGQRVREKTVNTQYLRAAALFTAVIVLGPTVHRLQPQLTEVWSDLLELVRIELGADNHEVGSEWLWLGAQLLPQIAAHLARHLAAVPTSTMAATVVCLSAKAVATTGMLLHLAVTERCDSQRCLRAKYFGALTSRGKSRRFGLPHIRLHKVDNVRMWLALRSHLRHQGPQRACNTMVSRCCTATLLLTLVTTVRFLEWSAVSDPMSRPNLEICRAARAAAGTGQQTEEILQALGSCMPEGGQSTRKFVLQSAANFDLVVWSSCLGFFSLRYIQISLYLNNKYKANVALLYSEQMHCHIRTYHKPHKRTELLTTIQVLKFAVREQSPPQRDSQVHHNVIPRDGSERLLVVANQVGAKLLKEMEGPHKISGLPMSPLYNSLFKLIVLSALSAIGSQMLGLNLRLWKISAL